MNVTLEIARYIEKFDYNQLPSEVIEQAKLCLLDSIVVAMAGAREEVSNVLFETSSQFAGNEQATVLGRNEKVSAPYAALINGTSTHALDYDDVYVIEPGHPSAPVIPAVLASGEFKNVSGKDILEAVILGIQIEYAIGEGVLPEHYDQGWHNTGTLGHFGAAAAVSKLLKLDSSHIINALGIAATQAAGLRKMFGTMCKPLHAGKAAMNGLFSAFWAEKGMNSDQDGLGGDLGFTTVYSMKSNPMKIIDSLSSDYHISKVRFKEYPSCRSTHATIDGMSDLRTEHTIDPAEIQAITCCVAPLSFKLCHSCHPQTGLEGKFSLEHCAAAALVEGPLYSDHFTNTKMQEPVLVNLRKKVKLTTDPSLLTSQSRLSVTLSSGVKHDIYSNLYGIEKERTKKERLTRKVNHILEPIMTRTAMDALLRSIETVDQSDTITSVLEKCSIA